MIEPTLLVLVTALSSTAPPAPAGENEAYVAAMAHQHQGDKPTASPEASLEPRTPVTGEKVGYADGVTGYLARPENSSGALPGLIVIHEWWGLNENIEAMARRLAGEGYLALAVDLYHGKVADNQQDAMAAMREAMSNLPAGQANLRAAHDYLKQHGATRIGVIGWCFGGGWSLQTALDLGDGIDAAVIYYGRLVTDPAQLGSLRAPVLGLFGSEDQSIPVESVKTFEKALQDLHRSVEVKVYDGANHAFANPSGTRYDAAAATDAWQLTTRFFASHLQK